MMGLERAGHAAPALRRLHALRCSEHLSESFQRAVGILAKRWTPLILYVLSEGPRRFSQIAAQLEFVSDRMLSERLKELEAEGLIERRIFAEVPVRVEYHLTEKGRDLGPVFMAIGKWASKWCESRSDGESGLGPLKSPAAPTSPDSSNRSEASGDVLAAGPPRAAAEPEPPHQDGA